MTKTFRAEFGDQLVTAVITADASDSGGKLDKVDYGEQSCGVPLPVKGNTAAFGDQPRVV